MSFRAIELQVALPRTQDVGKIQEQLQQRGQVTQDQLADEQKKLDELRQVSTTEETEKSKLEKERQDQKKREQEKREQQAREKKKEVKKEAHPYKGKFVDFSG